MATKLELNSGNFFFAQQLLMLLVVFLFQLKKKVAILDLDSF